ncbi:DUF4105 domain-containing protein [Planctomycetaceae bacterium SH139]
MMAACASISSRFRQLPSSSSVHSQLPPGPRRLGLLTCVLLVGSLLGCAPLQTPSGLLEKPAEVLETSAAALERAARLATTPPLVAQPSHDRRWRLEQAVLPYADLTPEIATIRNVRQCRWPAQGDPAVHHADWTIRWDDIKAVDFVVVPFQSMPLLSHTMLSFHLGDGRVLGVSVEARLEHHEIYSPLAGAARQYELIYVLADETDLLGVRGAVRGDDVYVYPAEMTAVQAADLLASVLRRVNGISQQPEYYDSLTNNCTTNLMQHVTAVLDDETLAEWSKRMPGHSTDRWIHGMGLLRTELPFEQARARAWTSSRIRQYIDEPDFSNRIRVQQNGG